MAHTLNNGTAISIVVVRSTALSCYVMSWGILLLALSLCVTRNSSCFEAARGG